MEINVSIDWTIGQLIELEREQVLRVNHEYQRGLRWSDIQKRLFLDSIFRGYSIPAFYFHKRETKTPRFRNTHFDIVDGQQRVNAIYAYSEGAFKLLDPVDDAGFRFPNFVKGTACPWGGQRFAELSQQLQDFLMSQKVVVYEITTDNENAIRDLFIRLQAGTPLTPQDKRDSWPGNFTEFILRVGGKSNVDKWFGLPLFKEIAKVSAESRRRQLAAQVFMLYWTVRHEVRFCDIRSANIDEFYRAQVDFDPSSGTAKRFERVCAKLHHALHGRPRIVGHYVIHAFLLVDALLDEFADGWEHQFADKLFEFDRRRRSRWTTTGTVESLTMRDTMQSTDISLRLGQMTPTQFGAVTLSSPRRCSSYWRPGRWTLDDRSPTSRGEPCSFGMRACVSGLGCSATAERWSGKTPRSITSYRTHKAVLRKSRTVL